MFYFNKNCSSSLLIHQAQSFCKTTDGILKDSRVYRGIILFGLVGYNREVSLILFLVVTLIVDPSLRQTDLVADTSFQV